VSEELPRDARIWRARVLITTWLSYAGFYFCRKNFAIVKSSVMESMQISTEDVAHIFTAYLFAYMLGQFATSYLGRRLPTRRLLLGGMALTVGCNLAFGLCYLVGPAGYQPMVLLMVINGFAQAVGWPGNVGVLSNWLRRRERGRVMAVWATSYQLGSIMAKVFAAFMLGVAGALWSFWGAAAVMAVVWVVFLLFERDHPEDVGLGPIVRFRSGDVDTPVSGGLFEGWSRDITLTVIFMGSCYFVFKFLRYSLDSWSPLAIERLFDIDEEEAGYISTSFDWVGFLGVLFAGWLSDRHFAGRRYQTIQLMTVGMLLAFVFLVVVSLDSVWLFGVGLSLCGFMLMGPDSLIAGVGAIDVGGRRGAVTAAGIINGLGSIGPILQEEIIGWMLAHDQGYGSAFSVLLAVSFLGIFGTAYLTARARNDRSPL